MRKAVKITAFVLLGVIIALLLAVAAYAIYVFAEYDRIDDNVIITEDNKSSIVADAGSEFTALTYNIGFGAYDQDFSFFMDSGVDKATGKKTSGKYGKATSRDNVLKNINGSIDLINDNIADFVMLQEVDTKATRSYQVNQYDMIRQSEQLLGYSHSFAINFHSAYLMYPLLDHHGKNESGIATLSKYKVESSVRRSYPVDTGFAKLFDLDRCLMISRVPLSNGKELTLINSHMSAYDEGGVIRAKQLEMLNGIMAEEYAKGNYVIVAGDFNHDLIEGGADFPTGQEYPAWVSKLSNSDLAEGFSIQADDSVGTCRASELPYEKGYNFEVVVDGFIVSDNVKVLSVKNIDNEYKYSDHNPSKLTFRLA